MMDTINFLVNLLSSFGTIVALAALTYQIITEKKAKYEEQANNVSTWIDNNLKLGTSQGSQAVVICNYSNRPIYEVIFSIDDLYCSDNTVGTGWENCSCINVLPPGKYVSEIDFDGAGMSHKYSSSITFRDHLGRYWTRNASGKLVQETGKNVINNKRKISQPYSDTNYRKLAD